MIDSIETPDGGSCVDLFQRDDKTFGFEEYRRDFEDQLGWFPVGNYSNQKFEKLSEVVESASMRIGWFSKTYHQKRYETE